MAARFNEVTSERGSSLIGVVVVTSAVLILLAGTMSYQNYVTKQTLRHRLKNDRFNIEQYVNTQIDCGRTWSIERVRCTNHQFINLHTRNPIAAPFIGIPESKWKKLTLKDKIGQKNNGHVVIRARCLPCQVSDGCPKNRKLVVEYSMFHGTGNHVKDPFTDEPLAWKSVKASNETFCPNSVWK